jgi:hypothetical protein
MVARLLFWCWSWNGSDAAGKRSYLVVQDLQRVAAGDCCVHQVVCCAEKERVPL